MLSGMGQVWHRAGSLGGVAVGSRATSPSAALGSIHSSLIPDRFLLTPHPQPQPQHPLGFLGPGSRYAQGSSCGIEKRSTGLGVRRPECDPGPDLRAVCLGVNPSPA